MSRYHIPGVHFDWGDRQFGAVSLARTDIAGFVGIAVRGPVGKPTRIESWNQYTSAFGAHTAAGYLSYAVEGFFANGGKRCWVIRVASNSATTAQWQLFRADGAPAMTLQAANPGTWAKDLTISVVPVGSGLFILTARLPDGFTESWRNLDIQEPYADVAVDGGQFFLRVSLDDPDRWQSPPLLGVEPIGSRSFNLLLDGASTTITLSGQDPRGFTVLNEDKNSPLSFQLLTAGLVPTKLPNYGDPLPPNQLRFINSPRFAGLLLNDPGSGSHVVAVRKIKATPSLQKMPIFNGGTDGLADLTGSYFEDALAQFSNIDEIAVLAMPDIANKHNVAFRKVERTATCTTPALVQWPDPPSPPEMPKSLARDEILSLQHSMVDQCTALHDRFAILDPPSSADNPDVATDWRNQFNTAYAACYYPWILVPDPLQLEGLVRAIPPSGHVAGIYARVEQTVGVHKPPANEIVEGAEDITTEIEDLVYGLLNDAQVNVVKSFRSRGVRVAGARTLSSLTPWLFVNVRRLFIAIERSVRMNLQWVTFEPNNPALWLQVDRVLRSFLEGLWSRGYLDGVSRDEAYSVTCDATTNPPSETDNGRVICEIGLLPPWPAEFVVVRIGITEGSVEMLTPSEVQVA